MIELILLGIAVIFIVIAADQQRRIHHLERELKNRPVGQIISAEITDQGLMMKGEVWDPKVKAKLAQDLTGFSIGPLKEEK